MSMENKEPMHAAIIYASHHHGNTKKIVDAVEKECDVTSFDAEKDEIPNLSECEYIGFASGIDFGKFYAPVTEAAKRVLTKGQKVFAMFTCGSGSNEKYASEIKQIATECGCEFIGFYGCKGYDSFGPFKLIGGINKAHPDKDDLFCAVAFCGDFLMPKRVDD